MSLYVVKFGGTSVATLERIRKSALLVKKYVDQGHQVVVVVSAMAGTTNHLLSLSSSLHMPKDSAPKFSIAETDVVAASGEQITAGLMAMALLELGFQAQSLLGSQVPIVTNSCFSNAQIEFIGKQRLNKLLFQKIIPVLAGFQGVYIENSQESPLADFRITTLGRGGSDTTAVAVAATLQADICYIYTDVEGIYTSDPRVVPTARKLLTISALEMLELAAEGAKVMHDRSVALALRYGVKLCILSSFSDVEGTYIHPTLSSQQVQRENNLMEAPYYTSIAHSLDKVLISFKGSSEGSLAALIKTLAQYNIIFEGLNYEANLGASFLISKSVASQNIHCLEKIKELFLFQSLEIDESIVTLTLVGMGISQTAPLLSLFNILTEHNISVLMLQVSQTKMTLVVHYDHMPKALVLLHDALLI